MLPGHCPGVPARPGAFQKFYEIFFLCAFCFLLLASDKVFPPKVHQIFLSDNSNFKSSITQKTSQLNSAGMAVLSSGA